MQKKQNDFTAGDGILLFHKDFSSVAQYSMIMYPFHDIQLHMAKRKLHGILYNCDVIFTLYYMFCSI